MSVHSHRHRPFPESATSGRAPWHCPAPQSNGHYPMRELSSPELALYVIMINFSFRFRIVPGWSFQEFPVKLNGGRHVQGILRGFDPFMNLVVDDSVEMGPGGQQNVIGMVVIRGNSIIMLEALERV
ncbi:small nuclear ribonucleoprotein G [Solea senegalensis]|uniref:Small nuclear ribonucleoprotein G n=1 Tax=Solea senegalensis TaxID=28829 RepID=A0AAV6SXL7_SOLSE|nr:small nuclear ribonucleoprotein G [Solea senegalensis]